MATTRTSNFRRTALDHFEPEGVSDPVAQRKLRGQLEQIDYTAFAASREVVAATVGRIDARDFQRVAVSAAHARARWVKEALALADGVHAPAPEQVVRLGQLRAAYEELAEVYEGLRRMVERGYVAYSQAEAR